MIARLNGILAETGADHLVIDVNGVGYLAYASARTLTAVGATGGSVLLLTEMQVREDAITLFGFGSAAERDWFRLLTGVQGVGGRVALAILSVLGPDELTRAVSSGDKAMIARANGVGPKLAQRIAMELRDKVGGVALGPGVAPAPAGSAPAAAAPPRAPRAARRPRAGAPWGLGPGGRGPSAPRPTPPPRSPISASVRRRRRRRSMRRARNWVRVRVWMRWCASLSARRHGDDVFFLHSVIPAKAGIHRDARATLLVDSGIRRDDDNC